MGPNELSPLFLLLLKKKKVSQDSIISEFWKPQVWNQSLCANAKVLAGLILEMLEEIALF